MFIFLKKKEGDYIDVKLEKLIFPVYRDAGNFKGRYLIIRGSRGSGKSCFVALKLIYTMVYHGFKYKQIVNVLAVRRYYRSVQNSIYAQLNWAIEMLGVRKYFSLYRSPLKIVFEPSNGEILFFGVDEAEKITSIRSTFGYLNLVGFEEFSEFDNSHTDFNKIDMSIRGILPEEMYYQIICTFNPWRIFGAKPEFFDKAEKNKDHIDKTGNIMAFTTTYKDNPFLDKQYLQLFEIMREENPIRYDVEGLGNGGVSGGLIFNNGEVKDFSPYKLTHTRQNGYMNYKGRAGLDFGYSDPTAFVVCLVNEVDRTIHICDEYEQAGKTMKEIADEIKSRGYLNLLFVCDSASPLSIEELFREGLNVKAARKGRDSIVQSIKTIQGYHIYVHPRCKNVARELAIYAWEPDPKDDERLLEKPIDRDNHLVDSLRYSCEDLRSNYFEFLI